MRDEVYALGLVFEADNGEELCVIHIPGPSKEYFASYYNTNVDQLINNKDVINEPDCDTDLRNKLWQVYNIGRVIGSPHYFTEKCDDPKCWEFGEFSYWESQEKYPNDPVVWVIYVVNL